MSKLANSKKNIIKIIISTIKKVLFKNQNLFYLFIIKKNFYYFINNLSRSINFLNFYTYKSNNYFKLFILIKIDSINFIT